MSDNLLDLHVSETTLKGTLPCIRAEGEMDINTSPLLRKAIDKAIDAGHTRLVIDFSEVRYIDSTGLGVLVAARKRLNDAPDCITVICSNKHTLKLFEITGLVNLFTVYATEAEFNEKFDRDKAGAP